MRKPLTVIIVTLSVVCTLKGMSRWSIQRIKAMLLCIEYGILFVDTVDTKIKACNALNAMFVDTVNTTVKTHPHIPTHNFLNIQWIFNPQKVLESWDSGLFNHIINTIYVNTVDTKHIHTFLPITCLIFNGFSICKKFWKAETQGFSTIPSILYMSILSIQDKDF